MNNAMTHVALRRRLSRLTHAVVAGLAATMLAGAALALEPVEIIVPFGPGGGADQMARHIAPLVQAATRAPVLVINVPGAAGNDGIARLLTARADGTRVAVLTSDTLSTLAYQNPRWNPAAVIPLAILMRQTSALFVPASSRFTTWQDFEKGARAQPRALKVAISGLGSPDFITLQQLAAKGIELTPLPLANPKQRYQAVLNGQADALYEQPGDVRTFVAAKQMRPILIFGPAQPAAANAGVPTSGEIGLGNGFTQFRAIVVKAGTNPGVVSGLADAFTRAAAAPKFKAFLETELAAADSFVAADGARTFIERELTQMKEVVGGMPLPSQYLADEKK